MLIDLHCHTAPLSACSSLTPHGLIDAARAAGLDGICLTEHDRLWPSDALARLADGSGLTVLRGMEITTEMGHLLVFGLSEPPSAAFLARNVLNAVREAGGLVALAHPARAGQPTPPRDVARIVDMVEILNGSDGDAANRAAAAFDILTPLPGIAGSDCHVYAEVGSVATRLPVRVATDRELVEVLRLGQHTVCRLTG